MSELPRRALTSVFFVAAVAGCILASRMSCYVLLTAIQAGCLYEYLRLIRPFQSYPYKVRTILHGLVLAFACLWHLSIFGVNSQDGFLASWLGLLAAVALLLVAEMVLLRTLYVRSFLLTVAGLVAISWTLHHAYLLTLPVGSAWYPWPAMKLFGVVLLIWAADTAAYFIGSQWGRHHLAPAVSPNKTWEGLIGGVAGSLAVGVVLWYFLGQFPLPFWLALGSVVAIATVAGDLMESWLKRRAGVKDSGSLLPGHGGLLDRFDGWLTAMPAAAYFVLAFAS
ncbi:MAG: phosphatidate cytidylyltransferase [Chitinophagales bacterium]|nr:phosphatidate cytidylyltransferase [Chitinophagales bacterium]MDW8393269.1 phosphatidate cytidylyltransferase [Chitinophagales bacterium]